MAIQMISLLPIQDLEYDELVTLSLKGGSGNSQSSLDIGLIDSQVVQVFIKEGRANLFRAPVFSSIQNALIGGLISRSIYFDYEGKVNVVQRRTSFNFNLRSIYTLIRRIW